MDSQLQDIQDEICYLEMDIENLEKQLRIKQSRYRELEIKLKEAEKESAFSR